MELVQTALAAAVFPAIVAGIFLVPWMPWARKGPNSLRRSCSAIGVLAAYLTSEWILEGFPHYPPSDTSHWVTFLGIGAIALVFIPKLESLGVIGRLPIQVAAVGAGLSLVWNPLIVNTWSTARSTAAVMITGFLMIWSWSAMEAFSARRPGAPFPIAMFVLLSGMSVITVLDESLKFGLFFAALAASQAAAAVVGWWGGKFRADGAYVLMLFSILFALMSATHAWAYLETTYDRFALYFGAMIAAGSLDRIAAFARLAPLKREGLRLTIILAFLAVALTISVSQQGASDTNYGYY